MIFSVRQKETQCVWWQQISTDAVRSGHLICLISLALRDVNLFKGSGLTVTIEACIAAVFDKVALLNYPFEDVCSPSQFIFTS